MNLFSEPIEKPFQNSGPFGSWIQRGSLECWERRSVHGVCIVARYCQGELGYSVNLPWIDNERGDNGIHLVTKTPEEGKQLVNAIIRLFGWE